MKGRYINFNLFLFLVLAPFSVFGFSIGDIEVDSTLNEKLNGEIPFHLRLNEKPSDIYVKVNSHWYDNRKYRECSFDKVKFPFTYTDYESFYNTKIAFVLSPTLSNSWGSHKINNYYHTLITNYLEEKGYYIFTKFFQRPNTDSIFYSSKYKYF